MPNIPRMDVAIPTVDAGIPSPPEDEKWRERIFWLAVMSEERGVDRKRDQRFVKALGFLFKLFIRAKNSKGGNRTQDGIIRTAFIP